VVQGTCITFTCGIWPTEKHCKAQDLGLGKKVSCAKTGGRILTIYTSYDVFLRKELSFGGRDDCNSSISSDVLIFLLFLFR